MIQVLRSKLTNTSFDFSAFYQFVWTLIKHKKESSDYTDHQYTERNGDVTEQLVAAWSERHTTYRDSFILSEDDCGYHVEAKAVHDDAHAWVEVTFTRNTLKEYTVSTTDLVSTKIKTLSKYLTNTYDLIYILVLYAMMSNRAFVSAPGDVDSYEWIKCYGVSQRQLMGGVFATLVATWMERLIKGEFLNDEIKWGASKIPKLDPLRMSTQLRDFLLEN